MSKPKPGTVGLTGAPASSVLQGAESVNRGLRLRVHDEQPEGHTGWIKGPFDLLAVGGEYRENLTPYLNTTVTARQVIKEIAGQRDLRSLQIFNCNLLKLVEEGLLLPGEMPEDVELWEGAAYRISVNAYERNPEARRRCLAHYGSRCVACDFDFGQTYGEFASGFIHVHHLRPLSEIGSEYRVDPIADLRPVCPNCHAVLHLGTPPPTLWKLKEHLGK